MLPRALAIAIVVAAAPCLAQDAGSEFDAAIPDGSVGQGGADQNSQETADGTTNTVCSVSRECERGFACTNNHCTYVGPRQAVGPCSATGSATLAFPLLLLWRWRRRVSARRVKTAAATAAGPAPRC